jgi:hypothetical protein
LVASGADFPMEAARSCVNAKAQGGDETDDEGVDGGFDDNDAPPFAPNGPARSPPHPCLNALRVQLRDQEHFGAYHHTCPCWKNSA